MVNTYICDVTTDSDVILICKSAGAAFTFLATCNIYTQAAQYKILHSGVQEWLRNSECISVNLNRKILGGSIPRTPLDMLGLLALA